MFNIGEFKAPGEDELPAIFYHINWEVVGSEVSNLVQEIWLNLSKLQEVIKTLTIVIAMVGRVETVNTLRPISLCNVL